MSEYLQVLKRVESERGGAATQPTPLKPVRRGRRPTAGARVDAVADKTGAALIGASRAFATLLDNVRAAGQEHPVRHVVFAAASGSNATSAVTDGMAAHARRAGFAVVCAEILETAGRSMLRHRVRDDQKVGTLPLVLDLYGPRWPQEFTDWLGRAASETSIVIIQGPSLAHSLDAALLSRACDGLVIVAELEVTTREALSVASERARSTGCRVLGVALTGAQDRMPRWLRSLLNSATRLLDGRER